VRNYQRLNYNFIRIHQELAARSATLAAFGKRFSLLYACRSRV